MTTVTSSQWNHQTDGTTSTHHINREEGGAASVAQLDSAIQSSSTPVTAEVHVDHTGWFSSDHGNVNISIPPDTASGVHQKLKDAGCSEGEASIVMNTLAQTLRMQGDGRKQLDVHVSD